MQTGMNGSPGFKPSVWSERFRTGSEEESSNNGEEEAQPEDQNQEVNIRIRLLEDPTIQFMSKEGEREPKRSVPRTFLDSSAAFLGFSS